MGVFVILALAGFAGFLIYWHLREREERRAELGALARRHGWRFNPEDDAKFPEANDQFALFGRGSGRRTYHTLTGTHATQLGTLICHTGDYRYTTGSGDDEETHRLSYLMVWLPLAVPAELNLLIRPEHLGDKLGALVGFEDINFESEEFSRKFFVKSNDRKFTYALIHPRTMEFLLGAPCGHLELRGCRIVLRDEPLARWSAAEFERALAWMTQFVELWPEYLRQDWQVRATESRRGTRGPA